MSLDQAKLGKCHEVVNMLGGSEMITHLVGRVTPVGVAFISKTVHNMILKNFYEAGDNELEEIVEFFKTRPTVLESIKVNVRNLFDDPQAADNIENAIMGEFKDKLENPEERDKALALSKQIRSKFDAITKFIPKRS